MGARGLIHVEDQDGTKLCTIYKHWDAYQTGLGANLKEFLQGKKLTNGIGADPTHTFNGLGCMAAALVGHLKVGAGDVYLYAPGSVNVGEEYTYTLYTKKDGLIHLEVVAVWSNNQVLYSGPIDEYAPKDS